jgi:Fe-S-cluster containining protein
MLLNEMDGKQQPAAVLATKTLKPRSGPLKGFALCACALLRGDLLKKNWCAVYKQRPFVCRDAVKPGDATCRWARMQVQEALEKEDKKDGTHG